MLEDLGQEPGGGREELAAHEKALSTRRLLAPDGVMSLGTVGQRCVSEREPELGLGLVTRVDRSRIEIRFPASGEQRLYALGTSVLKRVQFQIGETVTLRAGGSLTIESVQTRDDGLLEYTGSGTHRAGGRPLGRDADHPAAGTADGRAGRPE
jgi:hypothetical protein